MFEGYVSCLEGLLPTGLVQASLNPSCHAGELHPAEEVFVAGARDKRRRDFSLGRTCARAALHELRVPSAPIPILSGGAPGWPQGIVGSISHCDVFSTAVVGFAGDYLGLGVDAEHVEDVTSDILPVITLDSERDWLRRNVHVPAAVFFSAKEAVFKAWHPRTQHFLEFLEVELTISATNDFRVRSHVADLSQMRGRYAVCGPLILALAWWPVG
jgi:4'-phosphopantetheinyl transferase EntD